MTHYTLLKVLVLCFFLPAHARADARFFSSGLVANFEAPSGPNVRVAEEEAINQFIDEHFGKYAPDFEWRRDRVFRDRTHAHHTLALYYKGFRVMDQALHLDFNRAGFLEYAVSTWQRPFDVDISALSDASRWMIENSLKAPYFARKGYFPGSMNSLPVIWVGNQSDGDATAAFTIRFFPSEGGAWRHFVAEANSGRVLSERPVSRSVSISSKAWPVSPYNGGSNDLAPATVTLEGLEASNTLVTQAFKVRRMENTASPALSAVSPDLTTPASFSNNPDNYDYTCTGAVTDCPNQRIDAINVYYHLYDFRQKLQTLFDTLELDVPMVAPHDEAGTREPLEVYINAFGLNTDGDNDVTNEANNAGFYPYGCGRVGGVDVDRCLIFMRPKSVTSTECGSDKAFYDLAREAMVIVHEYQHFVTDSIVDMVPGSYDSGLGEIVHNVGDALHEGYSDYFGASIVSAHAGSDITKIGEYAFQNCSYYQRDLSTLRVYANGDAERRDSHVAGLSWASGLWKLRTEIGQAAADLIAMKSIFFLSTQAGFAESVEALVKADKALNAGVNVSRIRELFYGELKWGSLEGDIFRDREAGIVEVGFRSCSSAAMPAHPTSTGLLWILWMSLTWGVGRLIPSSRRRRERNS